MRILAVVNQKGGCGKTTIAVNLSASLAAVGKKVLLVDMDPQGHGSMAFGIEGDELEVTMYNALTDDTKDMAPLSSAVVSADENLWITPSNILLSSIEQQLAGKKGREDRLRNCLAEVIPAYDYCIIDCPPSLGLLTINVLRATQAVLIPIDMSRFSLQGIQRLLDTVRTLCSRTSHSIRAKVVANMYDSHTNLSKEVLDALARDFGRMLSKTVIHKTVKLAETAMRSSPITKHAPRSTARKEFAALAREIIKAKDLFETHAPFPASVTFSYFDDNAREIRVAGEFNNWRPTERHKLEKQENGKWGLRIPLMPESYEYKFIVDGEWRADPANPEQKIGDHGQRNSLLEVGGDNSDTAPASD